MEIGLPCIVTFMYAFNEASLRWSLWNFLRSTSALYQDTQWCVVGDLKLVRKPNDMVSGDLSWYDGDKVLDSCMRDVELEDLRFSGAFIICRTSRRILSFDSWIVSL